MTRKPNVLLFMCDQLQAEAIHDHSPCITPHFDALRARGITFDRAYTPNAVCSPARASLMTGLLPHNHGVLTVTHNMDDDQHCLRTDKPHWAQRLSQAGYHTGYFGKWHVERSLDLEKYGWKVSGDDRSALYRAKEKALQETRSDRKVFQDVTYHPYPEGYNANSTFYGILEDNAPPRPMEITTDLALDFLDDVQGTSEPWCCYLGLKEPHDPFICSKASYEKYATQSIELPSNTADTLEDKPNIYKKATRIFSYLTPEEHLMARTCYYASITDIDGQFGRIVHKLEEMGELENTLIVLTTDHGELLGAHGLYCKNIGAFEEVYNIPLVMAGPDLERGIHTSARVGLHDLAQTLLELTGCETIDVPDSRSFACVCHDHQTHEADYSQGFAEYYGGRIWLTQRVVWDGDWKFIFNGFDYDELYNLKEDPYELHNLIDEPPYQQKVKDLCTIMWRYVRDTGDHSLYCSHYPILRVAPYGPGIAD